MLYTNLFLRVYAFDWYDFSRENIFKNYAKLNLDSDNDEEKKSDMSDDERPKVTAPEPEGTIQSSDDDRPMDNR